jgi:hypothetical protein
VVSQQPYILNEEELRVSTEKWQRKYAERIAAAEAAETAKATE